VELGLGRGRSRLDIGGAWVDDPMMLGATSPSWPKTYSVTEAPEEMLDLAGRLMPLLLGGDGPTCVLLREQYARATIRRLRDPRRCRARDSTELLEGGT
jgi:hypothetical protein